MGDRVIITDDEPKPAPEVVVVKEKPKREVEKVITEKTVVLEKKDD